MPVLILLGKIWRVIPLPIAPELIFLINTPKRYFSRRELSIPKSTVIVSILPNSIPSDPSPLNPDDLPNFHWIIFVEYPIERCELLSLCNSYAFAKDKVCSVEREMSSILVSSWFIAIAILPITGIFVVPLI